MTSFDDLTHDHFRHPVPPERRVSGWQVALVIFSIGITLPIFFLGAELGQQYGLRHAATAFIGGCALLGILAAATAYVGARTGLSSYMIIEFSFGRSGAKVVNLLMAIALLGYFGATADIFGQSVRDALASVFGISDNRILYTFIGCLLMTATAVFGFRAIERLSGFAVPLLLIAMVYAVYVAIDHTSWSMVLAYPGEPGRDLGLAVSTVVGSSIQAAVLMPDVTRFARNGREAIKSVSGLAVGYPLVFLAAAVPSIAIGERDIMLIMIGLGLTWPALFVLVFSSWTTNTVNLYSTSMTLATIFTRGKEWKITLGAATVGTVFALSGMMDYFIPFLLWLGITTPPIAGIFLADYFVVRRREYRVEDLAARSPISYPAFLSWFGAVLVGHMSSLGAFSITSVPACDALFAAVLFYLLLKKMLPEARPENKARPESRAVDITAE